MDRKSPEQVFREARVDVLLGTRGPDGDRAVRLHETDALIRSQAVEIMGETLLDVSAELSADVPLTVSGTWYDGPTIALTKGVWMIHGAAQHVRSDATAARAALRLVKDSTVICTAQGLHPAVADAGLHLSLSAIVRVTGNVLAKLQMRTAAGAAAALMSATAPYAGSEPATIITACRMRLIP